MPIHEQMSSNDFTVHGLTNGNMSLNGFSSVVQAIADLGVGVESLRIACQNVCAEFDQLNAQYSHNKLQMNTFDFGQCNDYYANAYQKLRDLKSQHVGQFHSCGQEYYNNQKVVISELKHWQRRQALSGNGAQFVDNLDDIQVCIEKLVQIVCTLIDIGQKMLTTGDATAEYQEVMNQLYRHRHILISSSFVVEKQPPQVVKTNTKFTTGVRWLIGPQLNIHATMPKVACILLSEAQAQRYYEYFKNCDSATIAAIATSGKIVHNESVLEYQASTGSFSANFRDMKLETIKRTEKKAAVTVMDEKFALLFHTSSMVNGYAINVWTLSLPLVVIVHASQEPQSWATITWDNAFSEIDRTPFQVLEQVNWGQLCTALCTKFDSSTGLILSQENLNFLHEKLLGFSIITCAQFCKDRLENRSFTFWDWFYSIMKLIKEHLQGLWRANRIVGFINKKQAIENLTAKRVGTFLLRFSDSELGGITIAYKKAPNKVSFVEPLKARDLTTIGLADRIRDLKCLHYIYPDEIDKNNAFAAFYSQRNEQRRRSDGYEVSIIRADIPSGDDSTTSSLDFMVSADTTMQSDNDFESEMALVTELINEGSSYQEPLMKSSDRK